MFTTKASGDWTTLQADLDMPLVPGDQFALTLHVTAGRLNCALLGTGYAPSFQWMGQVDLLSTFHLGIDRNVQLEYVNLISAADCAVP